MGVQATVVFTDLHGSTAVFESLGNVRATEMVTQITDWIATQCEAHKGRVIKKLGDGVLAIFADGQNAVNAVVDIQRVHYKRILATPADLRLPIRIGVSSGEIEMVADDCYGDAVNVASRLCDLCGPHQIWASAASLSTVSEALGVSFRTLGFIGIRGRAEQCSVYQIEWRQDEVSEFLTMQGQLDASYGSNDVDALGKEIELTWMGYSKRIKSFELPINVGRMPSAGFVVDDPRVSRSHARLEWRNGSVMFVDTSSYGSWVRFAGGSTTDVLLRREECLLHGKGELALGASFTDPSVPTVQFSVV